MRKQTEIQILLRHLTNPLTKRKLSWNKKSWKKMPIISRNWMISKYVYHVLYKFFKNSNEFFICIVNFFRLKTKCPLTNLWRNMVTCLTFQWMLNKNLFKVHNTTYYFCHIVFSYTGDDISTDS